MPRTTKRAQPGQKRARAQQAASASGLREQGDGAAGAPRHHETGATNDGAAGPAQLYTAAVKLEGMPGIMDIAGIDVNWRTSRVIKHISESRQAVHQSALDLDNATMSVLIPLGQTKQEQDIVQLEGGDYIACHLKVGDRTWTCVFMT